MSTKTPRTFAREFKLNLRRQIQSGQKRPAQLCHEHQLTEGLLLRAALFGEHPFNPNKTLKS